MAYKHSSEIKKKMSQNGKGIPRPRANSEYRHLHDTGFYESWCKMKARCLNKKTPDFHRYGGRGIIVSESWLDFKNFYKDMYTKWLFHSRLFKHTSLDRIDNNKGYSKENCRWATREVQCNNRRSNRMLEYNGQKLNLKQWSEKLGIKRTTITQRLDAYGWSVEKTLST